MEQEISHKILIVDDEKSVGKSLGRLFMAENIDFIYSESAESALDEIKSAKKSFSLIISDQRMPGMQGTDFLEQAKTITQDTTRFLLTAYTDMDIIINSVNKGAVHKYINKPWDNDQLLAFIKSGLTQYEKVLEGEKLLKTAKDQNRQLFSLDRELLDNTKIHEKKIAELDKTIAELETKDNSEQSNLADLSDETIRHVEDIMVKDDKFDSEETDKLYANCIKTLYDEFNELANRNGFEMP